MLRLFIPIMLIFSSLVAQDEQNTINDNGLGLYPLAVDNFWEYSIAIDPTIYETVQVYIIADSLLSNGGNQFTQVARKIDPIGPPSQFFADTMTIIRRGKRIYQKERLGLTRVTFDFAKPDGTPWVSYYEGASSYVLGRVIQIDTLNVFNSTRLLKTISYYPAADSTDTTAVFVYSNTSILQGIGITQMGGGETFSRLSFRGASIDGILYGDTTSVVVGIDSEPNGASPGSFALLANYPNPFNGQTTFQFRTDIAAPVTLTIHDISGKEVATLLNRQITAGSHSVNWNATRDNDAALPSGVYLYRLTIRDAQQTRKLIYLK